MAFPTTSVIDNFNRGDSSTIGTNWTPLYFYGSTQPVGVYSNVAGCAVSQASNYAIELYNVATYGADCEAYITVVDVGSYDGGDSFNVFARMTTLSSSTTDGYSVTVVPAASNDVWEIDKITNFSFSAIGATFTQHISAGDKIGIACVGSTIQAWYCPSGGSWTKLTERTDTTYTAAGYVGFYTTTNWTNWHFDDFGGGTITSATPTGFMTTNRGFWGLNDRRKLEWK